MHSQHWAPEPDDDPVDNMQAKLWKAKHALKTRLGKKEDEHIVAGDAEVDGKVAVFKSIQRTAVELQILIDQYELCQLGLARLEHAFSRFLRGQSEQDKTRAGRMMAAVSKVQGFTAQRRLTLRTPLDRLYSEARTFKGQAVSDTALTLAKMEEIRREYRACLHWMKDVSENLDPERGHFGMEKFRRVQARVRSRKEKLDRMKGGFMQKVDMLAASRSNMFSPALEAYQGCLLDFWDKSSTAYTLVADAFTGYQYYEFKYIKDLVEPSKKSIKASKAQTNEDGTPAQADDGAISDDEDNDPSKDVLEKIDKLLLYYAEDRCEDLTLLESECQMGERRTATQPGPNNDNSYYNPYKSAIRQERMETLKQETIARDHAKRFGLQGQNSTGGSSVNEEPSNLLKELFDNGQNGQNDNHNDSLTNPKDELFALLDITPSKKRTPATKKEGDAANSGSAPANQPDLLGGFDDDEDDDGFMNEAQSALKSLQARNLDVSRLPNARQPPSSMPSMGLTTGATDKSKNKAGSKLQDADLADLFGSGPSETTSSGNAELDSLFNEIVSGNPLPGPATNQALADDDDKPSSLLPSSLLEGNVTGAYDDLEGMFGGSTGNSSAMGSLTGGATSHKKSTGKKAPTTTLQEDASKNKQETLTNWLSLFDDLDPLSGKSGPKSSSTNAASNVASGLTDDLFDDNQA